MENFQIPSNNPFDDRARAFIQSQKGQNLQRRYGVQPYEEENKIFDIIAWIGGYVCNGVSILTASTWLFSYAYSILLDLPSPKITSGFITITVLIGLEAIQRYFTTKYFKRLYHLKLIQDGMRLYGSSLNGLLAGMCICACISIGASFFGGFDFVKTVTSVPKYQAPTLLDISVIENRYQKRIDDAQFAVTDFAKKRTWKGRLNSRDGKRHQDLLDRKHILIDELLEQVRNAEAENERIVTESKTTHEAEVLAHEKKANTRGGGLGALAVVFISLFYLCMWYQEYYKFRTVSQYAVLVSAPVEPIVPPTTPLQLPPTSLFNNNNQDLTLLVNNLVQEIRELKQGQSTLKKEFNPSHNIHNLQNGVHSELKAQGLNGTLREGKEKTSVYTDTQPCTWEIPEHLVSVIDRYTIPHRNFKTGEINHMNYGQLKNRIDDYTSRVEEAKVKSDMVALANRESKLLYWNERMRELLAKANIPSQGNATN